MHSKKLQKETDEIQFISKNKTNNSHAYVEYCVIRDLSVEIFNEEYISDLAEWKKISYQQINIASVVPH